MGNLDRSAYGNRPCDFSDGETCQPRESLVGLALFDLHAAVFENTKTRIHSRGRYLACEFGP
jgi:hypothetical protein